MTRTVADMATVMGVLAGPENDEPAGRQAVAAAEFGHVLDAVPRDLRGIRVGLLAEGLAADAGIEPAVVEGIRAVAARMVDLGAEVVEVSVPEHRAAAPIAFAFYCEGQLSVLSSGGNGYGTEGRYAPELAWQFAEAMRSSDRFQATLKTVLLAGAMLRERGHGSYYAKAQNRRAWLRAGYDRALQGLDAILLPTTPMPAFRLDGENGMSLLDRTRRGWSMLANTPGSDISGHSALSMPAARVGDLPLGAMLIGRHFADAHLLRIAAVYEQQVGWYPAVGQGFPSGPAASVR
jgi:amidase